MEWGMSLFSLEFWGKQRLIPSQNRELIFALVALVFLHEHNGWIPDVHVENLDLSRLKPNAGKIGPVLCPLVEAVRQDNSCTASCATNICESQKHAKVQTHTVALCVCPLPLLHLRSLSFLPTALKP